MLDDLYALTPENKIDVEALQRLYDRVAAVEQLRVAENSGDGGWTDLPLLTNWRRLLNDPAMQPQVKVVNGIVLCRGVAERLTTTSTAHAPFAQMPAAFAPAGLTYGPISVNTTAAETATGYTIDTAGGVALRLALAVGGYVMLSGIVYPLG